MKYNFDELIPRRNTHCFKWDLAADDDILPMWVADMDFQTAPAIIDALARRVQHGIFGYAMPPAAYFEAVIGWFERNHHFSIQKEWIRYTTGVLPAISAILKALTVPGDQVIVQTPVYHCFFSVIRNNGCEIVSNELIYQAGVYRIDFDDLERKASDPKAKLMLLCSPHNPTGRVWTKDELLRIGEICLRHRLIVISDEIHCDLVFPGHQHIPFASLSDEFRQITATCTAPTKTFNLAGVQVAHVIVSDESIRSKVSHALSVNEVSGINAFAVEAVIAAYNEGQEWLDELKIYLYANYQYLNDYINAELPLVKVLPLEATYLVWMDFSSFNLSSNTFAHNLLDMERLWVNEGVMYGSNGEGFIRMNIACPKVLLSQGLVKLKNQYQNL